MQLHLPSSVPSIVPDGVGASTATARIGLASAGPSALPTPELVPASRERSQYLLVLWNVYKAWRSGSRSVPSLIGVLTGCCLTLRQGERVLVEADRGVGATTLLLVAAGIARPDSGIAEGPWHSGAGAVRFVPTTPAMPSSWTPRDAATAGAGSRWPRTAAATAVDRALRANGVAEVADIELRRLPVAAAWRASIAAAQLAGARLILVDREPPDAGELLPAAHTLAVAEPVVFGAAELRVVQPGAGSRQDGRVLQLINGRLVGPQR